MAVDQPYISLIQILWCLLTNDASCVGTQGTIFDADRTLDSHVWAIEKLRLTAMM